MKVTPNSPLSQITNVFIYWKLLRCWYCCQYKYKTRHYIIIHDCWHCRRYSSALIFISMYTSISNHKNSPLNDQTPNWMTIQRVLLTLIVCTYNGTIVRWKYVDYVYINISFFRRNQLRFFNTLHSYMNRSDINAINVAYRWGTIGCDHSIIHDLAVICMQSKHVYNFVNFGANCRGASNCGTWLMRVQVQGTFVFMKFTHDVVDVWRVRAGTWRGRAKSRPYPLNTEFIHKDASEYR